MMSWGGRGSVARSMMLLSSLEPRGPVSDAPIMPCDAYSCTGGSPTPANTMHNAPPWKLGVCLESSF
eukprot:82995-Pyramimonas_sp.AAC.1